jgi:hypothetical protein
MREKNYESPTIVDHGSLAEVTAMQDVGGPVDTFVAHPPGHSCPTGPPLGPDTGKSSPPCVGGGK